MFASYDQRSHGSFQYCGCYYLQEDRYTKIYLPQAQLDSHTTILATTSRTVLHQKFANPSQIAIKEVKYTFPLYDGVSVAAFKCTVGERVIVGVVKERTQAKADYDAAVSQGQTASLFEQNADAADVFTTSIGNVGPQETLLVEITYLGELKNDAQADSARFTIPTSIAPRYGQSSDLGNAMPARNRGAISITIDVILEEGVAVRSIQSPSHPIAVNMGRVSTTTEDDDDFSSNKAYATLCQNSTELDKDFIVLVQAKDQDTPRALLETHPSLPNQRALMTTLIPRFNIPDSSPEIVFVVDRSGSMNGKMHLVIDAMKVFLKSLPVSTKFNICSFGSSHSFLFDRSRTYDAQSLDKAMQHINPDSFTANYGGTEMVAPVKEALKRRYSDLALEVMLLTDGEIWDQNTLFRIVSEASKQKARFFTLGIGHSASSALIEGVARAGRGFSQWVNDGERIDKRLVRMLKAALMPHIKYKLEVNFPAPSEAGEDDFEIIESFEKSMRLVGLNNGPQQDAVVTPRPERKKISLFQKNVRETTTTTPAAGRYDKLPTIQIPNIVQVPDQLPDLYPHSRATVYLILGPDAPQTTPASVWLRGESEHGDLELEITIQDIGKGDTLHKLAAKKAMQDLEEGRGWLTEVKTDKSVSLQSLHEGKWDLIVEREAVRLGTTFQVGGKFCSFVAIAEKDKDKSLAEVEFPHSELANYDSQLMLLEQQNKTRHTMAGSAAPSLQQRLTRGMGFGTANRGLAGGPPQSPPGMSYIPAAPKSRAKATAGLPLFGSRSASVVGSAQPFSSSSFQSSALANSSPLHLFDGGGDAPSKAKIAADRSSLDSGITFCRSVRKLSDSRANGEGEPLNLDFSELEGDDETALGSFDFDAFVQGSAVPPPPPVPVPCSAPLQAATVAPFTHTSFLQRGTTASSAGLDKVKGSPALEKMQKLIDLQTFCGSWKCSQDFLAILTQNAVDTKQWQDQASMSTAVAAHMSHRGEGYGNQPHTLTSEVRATICAIAWLEVVMADEKDVWEMVANKARAWVKEQVKDVVFLDGVINGVKTCWRA